MRAKMEQYKVDVRVDGKSGYSTMVTASSTTEAKHCLLYTSDAADE